MVHCNKKKIEVIIFQSYSWILATCPAESWTQVNNSSEPCTDDGLGPGLRLAETSWWVSEMGGAR